MTLIPPGTRRRPPSEQEAISLELVSGLLMIIGLIAFAYLFYAIVTNADIREATQGPAIKELGLTVKKVEPQSEAPYFEMQPVPGGPAALVGVQAGDRLTKIGDVSITPDMTAQQVQDLLDEPGVKRQDKTFEVPIDFLRPQPDGSLASQNRVVLRNIPPALLIAYLKSFGFVVPLVVIALGLFMIRLGTRLRTYHVVAARWSLVALLWLMIGLLVVAVWAFWTNGKGGIVTSQPFNFGKGLSHGIPFLLAILPLAVAYRWLGRALPELFAGDETLSSRNTRFAWTLLVPTLVVLILVAARPLEQTFIRSLTNDVFGTSRPAEYVGLDNYVNLASFKFTTVNCQKDQNGTCARNPNGSIKWERSSTENQEIQKVLTMTPEQRQRYTRYQEARTWPIPGSTKGVRLLGKDPVFMNAFLNTLEFTVASVILELVLGMVIALVVHSHFRGRGLMRTSMLVPWAIPTVVSAVLWQVMMRPDQTGILNKLLIDLGLLSKNKQWLGETGPWMPSIIAIDVWKTSPFMALLLLAGLQTIPADIYEAADVDGASKLRQFFSVTLPLLRPTIAVALVFRTLDALRVFDVFQVLLDTTRPSMATYNYNILVLSKQDGYASAVGVMIFILILIFTVVYVQFVGIRQE
jgi:trehalose/maltose transport system permease protein